MPAPTDRQGGPCSPRSSARPSGRGANGACDQLIIGGADGHLLIEIVSGPDMVGQGHDRHPLRIALLGPVAWRTPPRHYGPWEQVTSLIAEGLVARGID